MKITKLELTGFKSFKNTTTILFDDGITGVVGPNGCGKSNIVDAILWVTGSTKSSQLRGSQMEDIIFAGTDQYPPSSFTQVDLTFEKSENGEWPEDFKSLSELVISRKLKRGGDSQYFINGESCLLRNVHDLLNSVGAMGFSTIEQGTVAEMISYKPEQLRDLIDQVAGTAQFKNKKRLAQNKLKSTQQNILRVEDVLTEQNKQLKRLEKQSGQAREYAELKEEITQMETRFFKSQYLDICHQLKSSLDKIQDTSKEENKSKEYLKTLEEQYKKVRESSENIYSDLKLKGEELSQKRNELNQCEIEVQRLKISIESESDYIQKLAQDVSGFQSYRVEKDKEIATLQKQIGQEQARLSSLEEGLKNKRALFEKAQLEFNLMEKERSQNADKESKNLKEVARLEEVLNGLGKDKIRLENSIKEYQNNKTQTEKKCVSVKNKCVRLEKQITDLEASYLNVKEEIRSAKENIEHLGVLKESQNKELEECSLSLAQMESRKHTLISQKTGLPASGYEWVKKEKSYSTLHDILEVNKKYQKSIEAVLAQKIYGFVLESDKEVQNLLKELKTHNLNRVYMFLEPQTLPSQIKEDCLRDKVQLKASAGKYSKIVDFLFNRVVVVDSLQNQDKIFKKYPDATLVTLEGDCSQAGVGFSGGETTTLDISQEIDSLESQITESQEKQQGLKQQVLEKDQKIKNLNTRLTQLTDQYNKNDQTVLGLKKELEFLKKECTSLEETCAEYYNEVQSYQVELEDIQNLIQVEKKRYEQLKNQKQDFQNQTYSNSQQVLERRDQAKEEMDSAQMQVMFLKKDLKSKLDQVQFLKKSMDEMSKKEEEFSKKSTQNRELIQKNESQLETMREQHRVKQEEYNKKLEYQKSLEEAYQGKLSSYKGLETQISELNQSSLSVSEKKHQLEVGIETLYVEKKNLEEKAFENYQLELAQYKEDELKKDIESTQKETSHQDKNLGHLKDRLAKMGQVNLLAVSEYEQISEEHQCLQKQYDDLERSKKDLEKVIQEMDEISEKKFKKAFEEVNVRLAQVFTSVFGGGKAQLTLVGDDTLGVEILACPPGKKLKNLKLLSGGEKSLTALSMVLALFLVRPAPFCILDEVDAALDDQNIVRFNSLMKEIARRCQVILVTHNKYSMKECQRLYGVTMEEKGITQMITVDIKNQASLSY